MKLKLKDEYIGKDITISFNGKGGVWTYNVKSIKPNQFETLFNNGYKHLFEVEEEDMPLYEIDDEDKGLIDYTSYKKKAVTAKKSKLDDEL